MNKIIISLIIATILSTSCTSLQRSMQQPNTLVNLEKDDFEFSDQVAGSAKSTRVFGIDFQRLFKQEGARVEKESIVEDPFTREVSNLFASIPVYGNLLSDPTANYALYDMMQKNEGYDVVFYPQYEVKVKRPVLGLGFIFKTTEVEVKAKLAKIK
ncbi:hypothetical protein [Marivirga arenosa]|uniref:Uncharacterized protein n=1 Tax=Marivirga arenosa TaxID=3059076 RepID=A0AA49JAA9_9BACT|nr:MULTISPECIES: hypothetical protein [unclassified Marivirga]WKK85713.2 hypothetical protein QYS48_01005 [Marivirga sp. ABR2-2]WNB17601.1 hypothetical protein QYS47_34430 [Marivirga sp. BKB1-2]